MENTRFRVPDGLAQPENLWTAQGYSHVSRFQITVFWNESKGVKNPHVILAGFWRTPNDSESVYLT